MATRDLDRLARMAKQRRLALGLALNDKNAKAAGTSKGTWARVEKGQAVRDISYPKIDGLLQWASGSCVAAAEGHDPVPTRPSESAAGVTISDMTPEEREAKASDVVRLAAIATTGGMSADQIRAFSDRAVRDLKAAGLI